MWCAVENYNYMRHICGRGFLDLSFSQTVIGKTKMPRPNFTYSQKQTNKQTNVTLKVYLERDRPTASILKLYGMDIQDLLFHFFFQL